MAEARRLGLGRGVASLDRAVECRARGPEAQWDGADVGAATHPRAGGEGSPLGTGARHSKKSTAFFGAAMCKLVHLIYGVLKSGVPFDAAYTASSVDR